MKELKQKIDNAAISFIKAENTFERYIAKASSSILTQERHFILLDIYKELQRCLMDQSFDPTQEPNNFIYSNDKIA